MQKHAKQSTDFEMLRSKNTRSYWSLWKRNLKVIKEVVINIKQKGFSLFPLFCDLLNHMADDFVERIKSICFLSHPWSRQEASLWHELMPLFCLFELFIMLQEFTFLFNPLSPRINKLMSATCGRPKQPTCGWFPFNICQIQFSKAWKRQLAQ